MRPAESLKLTRVHVRPVVGLSDEVKIENLEKRLLQCARMCLSCRNAAVLQGPNTEKPFKGKVRDSLILVVAFPK